ILRRYGPTVRPDWVLLGFFPFNDLSDNVRLPLIAEDASGIRLMSHHFSPAHRFMLGAKLWIGSVSHLYAFSKPRVKELLSTPWLVKVRVIEPPLPPLQIPAVNPATSVTTASSSEGTRAFRITDALIRMTAAEAQQLGAEFVVLTVPSRIQVVQPRLADDQDRLERDFATVFERARILHIEALETLRQSHQRGATPFFTEDHHLNAVGHRVIGERRGRWVAPRFVEGVAGRGGGNCREFGSEPIRRAWSTRPRARRARGGSRPCTSPPSKEKYGGGEGRRAPMARQV